MKRLGFNFNFLSGDHLMYDFFNQLTFLDDTGDLVLSDNVAAALAMPYDGGTFSMFIDALKANGLVKILAEPNLICLSGEEAEFLAGGEVPVPVPQGLGTTAIEYKPFGVGLQFKPTVLDGGRINLHVEPEVSDLDQARGIILNNFEVPAISTRRASTTVELGPGQSFAIAGLISDNLRENVDRYPVLGDIPILGALFRSSSFQKNQSELVIIITPHMVQPMEMAGQSLPTDGLVEPNDFEFYMLGLLEGNELEHARAAAPAAPGRSDPGGFDGPFGHSVPQ